MGRAPLGLADTHLSVKAEQARSVSPFESFHQRLNMNREDPQGLFLRRVDVADHG